ncbi:MAG: tyrosine-type recombinase/integrase [SAR324 cluster bacterium]|nr:tyrosine-type recombinase/integrase [SAR324 cluster bacterium]
MSKLNLPLGYDPKCRLYRREQTQGNVMYYLSYYLPNGQRVQRPVHRKEKEAKKLLRLKELQLIQGQFDSKDSKKLDGFLPRVRPKPERLTIKAGLREYFEVTEARKTRQTHYCDVYSINRYFGFFLEDGKVFMDDIRTIDVQMLIRALDKEGKSESTIKNAVTMVKKVFNCLIHELKNCDYDNPVIPKMKLPKRNGLVRNRIATDEEIVSLLNADDPGVSHSSNLSPTKAIVAFLICTGARLSEVLHAEWGDFDFENGIWHIKTKPNCPTRFRLGWSPKWYKDRGVLLFPEALEVLRRLPRVKSIGRVPIRDESGKIVDHKIYPADFVFPKTEISVEPDGTRTVVYSRIDSVKRSWSSMKNRAGVTDLQIKDLRTFFNLTLKNRFGFSSKEAGYYIGNSKEVNDLHYTPISIPQIQEKMKSSILTGRIIEPVN